MRDANRPAVGVSAVVVDVGVEAGAVFDVVEVTNEHLIDHICDALSHVVQEWTEHMFVRYERRRTECPIFLQFFVQPRKTSRAAPWPRPRRLAQPSEDQTSRLVAIRSVTAVVKSVVPAEPPRSKVLTPEATVSSAAS